MSVDASIALLAWYAVDKRRLPWRAEPGEVPDPYRIWLSEIMLQQTTVAAVRPYFEKFVTRWPSVEALAAADYGDVMAAWAGLGYYARARNLLACARKVAEAHGGRFPDTEAALRALPGIGRYTAAAIAAIAFGRRAVVVDANVERVVSRLFAVDEPLPAARERLYALADRITPERNAGDFAQAMMDLGSAVCTPRAPECGRCPLASCCTARAAGTQSLYPRKAPKAPKPRRDGVAYWLEHDGHVRLVRRPAKGLLGGMLALPTDAAPAEARWREAGSVDHVFTHFALTMKLLCAEADSRPHEEDAIWWPIASIGDAGLPTLFARLAARGTEWREAA
ncbi:A/G-specific adenine glycosylase [Sphingosinicella sp. BN140058]|uniref:A/G-specific adenine glycosylase n=1 Tax=Sphingosinicella sp. BN140058 TaxID=1892855 RepID=UPI001011D497|nr:A/G-specific adenine glycosylase [Sphingosinicella sp. BN140058]QAY76237.1 A/G-specific adenine glycosylase [Sphingosinicella sp. BN140058]